VADTNERLEQRVSDLEATVAQLKIFFEEQGGTNTGEQVRPAVIPAMTYKVRA
jgi:hypothetical protein